MLKKQIPAQLWLAAGFCFVGIDTPLYMLILYPCEGSKRFNHSKL